MIAPDILANVSRGWNRAPAGVALGTDRTGVSAALWTHITSDAQEVWADPDPGNHILASMVSSFWAETFIEGDVSYCGVHRPGMVNLVHAGRSPRAVIKGPFCILHLYVPEVLPQRLLEECGGVQGTVELIDPRCTTDGVLERIGREMLAEMRDSQPLSRLRIDALGLEIGVQLLRKHSSLGGGIVSRSLDLQGRLAPWQLKRAIEYLMEHLDDDVSLPEIAEVAQLSSFHFARAFKRSTGLPPARYLMNLRVERAKQLLAGSTIQLAEIAVACGFAGQSHFTTAFKRHTGMTPGAWRATVRC